MWRCAGSDTPAAARRLSHSAHMVVSRMCMCFRLHLSPHVPSPGDSTLTARQQVGRTHLSGLLPGCHAGSVPCCVGFLRQPSLSASHVLAGAVHEGFQPGEGSGLLGAVVDHVQGRYAILVLAHQAHHRM